ncbi:MULTISPECIES: hypothetical protein [unclassified Microbacterium]|uniref:hypothetical protein n=1 Tax=unclassified Microbacterium TaxID=2609290 RepID=UPI002882FC64|nr:MULTISPECIES: hypothetical protein [unclassified Microbacterium]
MKKSLRIVGAAAVSLALVLGGTTAASAATSVTADAKPYRTLMTYGSMADCLRDMPFMYFSGWDPVTGCEAKGGQWTSLWQKNNTWW